jgi:hypothetical protein
MYLNRPLYLLQKNKIIKNVLFFNFLNRLYVNPINIKKQNRMICLKIKLFFIDSKNTST